MAKKVTKTSNQIKILNSYNLTSDEYDYLINFFRADKSELNMKDQKKLLNLYNKMFNQKRQPTSCVPCWIEMLEALHKIYLEFNGNNITTTK